MWVGFGFRWDGWDGLGYELIYLTLYLLILLMSVMSLYHTIPYQMNHNILEELTLVL